MPYLGNEVAPLVQALEGKELKLDSDGDSSITADTDDQIDFKTGGSDRLQIQSTAGNNVVIADGLTLTDGNIVVASGHGIDFSATSDKSGMTGELLDDYEEGTFTPAFDFLSASPSAGATVGQGVYTKIGRLVTVHVRLVNVNSSGATGDVSITGMPFTSLLDSGDGAVTLYTASCRINDTNIAGSTYVTAEILDNVAVVRLIECTDNTAIDLINAGNINHATSDFHFTLTYPTQ